MERILKKAGASRVSPDACEKLAELLEAEGIKLGQEAVVASYRSPVCLDPGAQSDRPGLGAGLV